LVQHLEQEELDVVKIVRSQPGDREVRWDPGADSFDATPLEGVEAVVHLAGENVAASRWTDRVKQRIRDSRVHGTRVLAEGLARMSKRPQVLVSASAIGFYGNRGDELLTETSDAGDGFLCDVAKQWESATDPARGAGIRVVNVRLGMVLSPDAGALKKMLPPFKLGGGGPVGSGQQFVSWISLDDVTRAIRHAITDERLTGPVNAVSPEPVRNKEFAQTLGRVLGRPAVMPIPAFAVRLALGEMADELLLASTRVSPGKLIETGFEFQHPELEATLRHLLR
jgi:uncharacterized protein (TIGR01777 family)